MRTVECAAALQHITPLHTSSSSSSSPQTALLHEATRVPTAFHDALWRSLICSGVALPLTGGQKKNTKKKTVGRQKQTNKKQQLRKADPRFAHPPFTNNLCTHAATFPRFTPVLSSLFSRRAAEGGEDSTSSSPGFTFAAAHHHFHSYRQISAFIRAPLLFPNPLTYVHNTLTSSFTSSRHTPAPVGWRVGRSTRRRRRRRRRPRHTSGHRRAHVTFSLLAHVLLRRTHSSPVTHIRATPPRGPHPRAQWREADAQQWENTASGECHRARRHLRNQTLYQHQRHGSQRTRGERAASGECLAAARPLPPDGTCHHGVGLMVQGAFGARTTPHPLSSVDKR